MSDSRIFWQARRHLLVVARRTGLDSLDNVQKEHLSVLRHMHSLGEKWAVNSLKEDPSLSFRIGYHLVLPAFLQDSLRLAAFSVNFVLKLVR